jgi:hypothetical protein
MAGVVKFLETVSKGPAMIARCPAMIATLWFFLAAAAAVAGNNVAAVNESARQIPVAYQVDVVVVGGGTGAVSAAVAAAKSGAKVFLAAPRPYLGDDMTATLRLWLEPGEEPAAPLAKQIFSPGGLLPGFGPHPSRIPFVYQADRPTAKAHKDTDPPSLLTDGKWGNPSSQSVQYDADVNITADLGKPQQVKEVRLMYYSRPSGDGSGFDVKSVTIFAGDDKQSWTQLAVLPSQQRTVMNEAPVGSGFLLAGPIAVQARYVKLSVQKGDNASRILLGELEIIGPAAAETAPAPSLAPAPRPLHVKKTLDDTLLAAGVTFLYSCYATDVLRDGRGNPCGIVMANRAGRQAVVAKTIIDATDRAVVARLAGAQFRPYPAGAHTFGRVVIGGQIQQGENMRGRIIGPPFHGPFPNRAKTSSGEFPIIEYTLQLPMKDDSYASFAAADQQARSMTYHPEQQFTSDWLFEVPPDPMRGQDSAAGEWQGVDKLPLGAFRPAGVSRLLVLGGCADVSRPQAEKLLRPLALMDAGARLGTVAAAEAKSLPTPAGVKLPGKKADRPAAEGEVRELLVGVRPIQHLPSIAQEQRALPVLGRYDVVVIGGGTGGAPAGIAAARQGAKTLVVEYLYGLGGVGTAGAITSYYAGNRVGFTATVPTLDKGTAWVIEQKMQWWRSELCQAGADIWFGTIGCGALLESGRITGAVVATPLGRGVVLAKAVIDATGNADVAAAAGAQCVYTDQSELAMQGTGLPPRQLGASSANTDFTIADETDLVDIWHLFVYAKDKYPDAFDQGQLVDTRERRRIVGEFTMTVLDQLNRRIYADTIVQARGGKYDTHGYTVDPLLMLKHPETASLIVNIPYRCFLPKRLDGILVIGLGLSAHRDALPLLRMQADIQNGGYAAGAAAAMIAKESTASRNINVRALQKHLIEIGNLPEGVLDEQDSYPLPAERVASAVENLPTDLDGAAVILAQPAEALPLLRQAYAAAQGEAKSTYAYVLAVMGDAAGLETLRDEVKQTPQWDRGWNYRGMGQFGSALSPLDNKLVALGRTGRPAAVPVILEKLQLLSAESEFSHHRAVGLALELTGDPAAAKPLADLLAQPGMSGYVHSSLEIARKLGAPGGTNAEQTRRESLRELLLARALYRCGDYQGVGEKILRAYTQDLRGHLARHAQAVLEAGKR